MHLFVAYQELYLVYQKELLQHFQLNQLEHELQLQELVLKQQYLQLIMNPYMLYEMQGLIEIDPCVQYPREEQSE